MTETTPPGNTTLWTDRLVEQVDWHWQHALRPRLDGLSDEEYFWEPAPGWNVRPRDADAPPVAGVRAGSGDVTIDFAFPEPDPAPLTTIAWRLGHIIVGVLAMRNASHFGGPAADYESWSYAATADEALAQLDAAYSTWIAGVRGLGDAAMERPCGPAEGPYGEMPMATLVMHIHRELIHHGAEIALLRDLYLHTRSSERTV